MAGGSQRQGEGQWRAQGKALERRVSVTRPPTREDAERLENLYRTLSERQSAAEWAHKLAKKRELVARLRRLGLPVPPSYARVAEAETADLDTKLALLNLAENGP